MRFVLFVFTIALAACASTQSSVPYPAAQEIVDAVASRHPDLTRLTLHAVPDGTSQVTQVASTVPERRGKPSDPEDLEAMRTGAEIVLEEAGALDVTVPILMRGGSPTAIAGVTLKASTSVDRAGTLVRARSIARELENELRSAGAPLW
jgi:hypothetical protein